MEIIMDFLTIVGFITVTYFAVLFIALLLTDCDLKLAWAEKFGRRIDVLKGKVVWVTGASSGIGENIAYILAEAGARIVLSARRRHELERVKQKCLMLGKYLNADDIMVLPFDMREYDVHQECFNIVIQHFGTLDVLINNAGRSQRAQWENIELSVDKELFELNVFSIISLSRIAVRYFLNKGSGHIAVTSSLAGVFGVPFSASYNGTKHALHGYFNGLYCENYGKNLHVTLLCPGPTFTNYLSECFTAKPGKKYGKSVNPTDKRMTGRRCAQLCLIAIANHQREAWLGVFPLMPLFYLFYYPNLGEIIASLAAKYLLRLRDSKEFKEDD